MISAERSDYGSFDDRAPQPSLELGRVLRVMLRHPIDDLGPRGRGHAVTSEYDFSSGASGRLISKNEPVVATKPIRLVRPPPALARPHYPVVPHSPRRAVSLPVSLIGRPIG
jgi:hypothetical protein